ncbi:unnamed protein product [Cylicostephanus goldi]|uniref:Uncharacterized protein n=1 Tax=Cylicostephanus goldi TaxID=71465 RepID=A0A3P6SEG5_CYLGO|nr:unnamed protein product [Cylicostephanus goldi]
MFRLLLLVLLCQIYESSSDDSSHWPHIQKVEVTIIGNYYMPEEEVKEHIYNYGQRHGLSDEEMQVHLVEKCGNDSLSPKRFEVHVTQCNDFRKYLLHAGRFMHDLKMIHVKCDHAHYAHCLKSICKETDYVDLVKCAYNNMI